VNPPTGVPVMERRERYRVVWLPGTDILHGFCYCGASTFAEDPVLLWTWLLAHPEGHTS
jgi:hypothetical protein